MAKQRKAPGTARKAPKSARITPFARANLDELVASLATTKPVLEVDDPDIVGALIVAARGSPTAVVKAVVGTYRDMEAELAAVTAVMGFVQAYGRSGREPNA
jgi:hypothetical protein